METYIESDTDYVRCLRAMSKASPNKPERKKGCVTAREDIVLRATPVPEKDHVVANLILDCMGKILQILRVPFKRNGLILQLLTTPQTHIIVYNSPRWRIALDFESTGRYVEHASYGPCEGLMKTAAKVILAFYPERQSKDYPYIKEELRTFVEAPYYETQESTYENALKMRPVGFRRKNFARRVF